MPTITVSMYEGRTDQQKTEIVEVFTKELSRILEGKHGEIKVAIKETPRPLEDK